MTRDVLPIAPGAKAHEYGLSIPDVSSVHYLRAVAALSVTLHHAVSAAGGSVPGLAGFGVDIFFVVSGFIIPYSMWLGSYRVSGYARFVAKRLIRLEPAYIASLALSVALAYAAALHPLFKGNAPDFTAPQLLAHLFYLIPMTEHDWVNPVYWTLAYEFAFYLTIGALFPLCIRSGLLFATTALACLTAVSLAVGEGVEVHRLGLFFFGLAAFRTFSGLDSPGALALNLGLGCLFMFCNPHALNSAVLAPVAATSMVGLVTALWLLLPVRRPSRSILFLSHISYSLYLLHAPIGNRVVHIGERLIPGTLGEAGAVAASLAASIAAAYVWYRLFELPGIRLSKRLTHAPAGAGSAHLEPHYALSGK